jgi:ribosome biogenesis GTPase A
MQTLLQTIKEICTKHSIIALDRNIQIIDHLLSQNKAIDVAVLGQFKAGKSSFLNSFIGKEILPTGVIPLTSVITRMTYSDKENMPKILISLQLMNMSQSQRIPKIKKMYSGSMLNYRN